MSLKESLTLALAHDHWAVAEKAAQQMFRCFGKADAAKSAFYLCLAQVEGGGSLAPEGSCVCVCVCMHVCMCVCACVCVCVCARACACACVQCCMYVLCLSFFCEYVCLCVWGGACWVGHCYHLHATNTLTLLTPYLRPTYALPPPPCPR